MNKYEGKTLLEVQKMIGDRLDITMNLSHKNKIEREVELQVNESFCKLTKDFIKASDIVLQNFKSKVAFGKVASDADQVIGTINNEKDIVG